MRAFSLKCDVRLSESSLPILVKLLMLVLLLPGTNEAGAAGDLPSSLEESLCVLPTLLRLERLGPPPRCAMSAIEPGTGDKREASDSVGLCDWSSTVG